MVFIVIYIDIYWYVIYILIYYNILIFIKIYYYDLYYDLVLYLTDIMRGYNRITIHFPCDGTRTRKPPRAFWRPGLY